MTTSLESALSTLGSNSIPLAPLLSKVCATHFSEQAALDIRWGIPPATPVTRLLAPATPDINRQKNTILPIAMALIREEKWLDAANVLRPLADAGHIDAEQLLILTLKRAHADWEPYAQRKAARMQSIQVVTASIYLADQKCIVLHQYLAHRRAPRFVLIYLIYHECARIQHDAFDANHFTPAFLATERKAPYRDKAILWLKRHGFPTFRLQQLPPLSAIL